MSWKRPLWLWILAYPFVAAAGSLVLCTYSLALMAKDGDYGGPLGFVIAMVVMGLAGAVGGAGLVALIQLGIWLYQRFRNTR